MGEIKIVDEAAAGAGCIRKERYKYQKDNPNVVNGEDKVHKQDN